MPRCVCLNVYGKFDNKETTVNSYLAKNEAAAEALGGGDIADDLSDIIDEDDDGGGEDILDILGGGDCTLMGDPGADCELK